MEIKYNYRMDYDTYKKLNKFLYFNENQFVLFLFLLFFVLVYCFLFNFSLDSVTILGIVVFLHIYTVAPTKKRFIKTYETLNFEMVFCNSDITVKLQDMACINTETFSYTFIKKLYDTKEIFYIITPTNKVRIIKKSDLDTDTLDKLTHLLKANVTSDKYILKNK